MWNSTLQRELREVHSFQTKSGVYFQLKLNECKFLKINENRLKNEILANLFRKIIVAGRLNLLYLKGEYSFCRCSSPFEW